MGEQHVQKPQGKKVEQCEAEAVGAWPGSRGRIIDRQGNKLAALDF